MVGKKLRTSYHKKRKGKPFSGVPAWSPNEDETVRIRGHEGVGQPSTSTSTEDSSGQISTPIGASRHKLSDRGFSTDSSDFSGDDDQNDEFINSISYKFVSDVNVLASTLSEVHKCPEGLLQFLCS